MRRPQPSARNHCCLIFPVTVAGSVCNVIRPHEGSEGPRSWRDVVMGEGIECPP